MEFMHELERAARSEGANFFGVADLAIAYGEILQQGGAQIAKYPFAISIGIKLLDGIVYMLPHRHERAVAMNYLYHGYSLVNRRLDFVSSQLGGLIQEAGYRALPIPASQTISRERLIGAFSHKLAAHLAGHGWIGKSCLLITPEVGPRVRWASILTDAPLIATGQAQPERCGDCLQCVEICPVQAFTGRPFFSGEPRALRYDASKCDEYFETMEEEVAACGLCLYICPIGRRVNR